MPTAITDVSTFTDPIMVPASTDPASKDSIVTLGQGLANRTRMLFNAIGGAVGDKTIILGPSCMRTKGSQLFFAYVQLDQNDQPGFIDVADYLPSGATLKEVHLAVKPGFGRATGDAMLLKVFRQAWSGFPAGDPTPTQLGSDDEDDGSNGRQWVAVTGLTEVVDRDTTAITVQLQAGNDAGTGGREDRFYGCKLVFTDPGPRSF